MLELSYNNGSTHLNLTVFPKTILFLRGFTHLEHLKFYNFLETSCLAKNLSTNLDLTIFCSKLSVSQNLDIISPFLVHYNLKEIILKYFNINQDIFTKKINELTEEEKTIISTSYLLFNQTNIWILRFCDKTLSDFTKNKIEKILLSKVANSNSIIFYSTESGQMLNIQEQVIL